MTLLLILILPAVVILLAAIPNRSKGQEARSDV